MISAKGNSTMELEVIYGLGGGCRAKLPRNEINGQSARQLIRRVAETPQPDIKATRTAQEVTKALRSRFGVDVELLKSSDGTSSDGEPVVLDEPVFPGPGTPSHRPVPDRATLRLSESYRGG